MTTINQNQKNPTPQARMEVEAINVKPQEAISVIGSGNTPYQVDVTPLLLEHPDSPFAIALSVAVVLGAIAGLIKTLKSK
ncbi:MULTISPECIES: hypothetical protein [Cyanophyceae]|uniref:hypothetical protein n=1 Tax=Cyanophyceae TaxID=3028117 RepID=UPI00232C5E5C|nr:MULTISPECIES: hypothetical protein [Cyanophyceae]MDB9357167.1 hypothetical protein [Nodularia spumigena CS-587/03]MDB9303077.1 hypothetical protein [Nodularia spumigena CS-591/12]MDB9316744.1 hypothetical protein [Nodularia spumigena CS-590/01A]MDB9327589.1 hypothetical protein [Nodularia spumigena CS-590/02]MDB9336091.1 hypothetical protein [Nodularia spumigena CS-590/01]